MPEPLTFRQLDALKERLGQLRPPRTGTAAYELHTIADRLIAEVFRLRYQQAKAITLLGDRAHDVRDALR